MTHAIRDDARGELHTASEPWPGQTIANFADYGEIDICPRCGGDKFKPYSRLCSACVAELRGVRTNAAIQAQKLTNHQAFQAWWAAHPECSLSQALRLFQIARLCWLLEWYQALRRGGVS